MNFGRTRADHLFELKVGESADDALSEVSRTFRRERRDAERAAS
ncbi:MAG TPA: hypothetical protein VFL16_00240 [Steroidobacteraceae bacterium]|nr:hypothetical protein [Steroidobacteraceae bacterium]